MTAVAEPMAESTAFDFNPRRLARTAFDILAADLERHGNVLGQWHRAALHELVDTFAGYLTGDLRGRRAFPLPTGMGKTSAVIATLTALHRLGYRAPVSVAASQVEALCKIKRELVARGVPECLIGLKHAQPQASEPSTGDDSRLFQLVTHARVRSGRDLELFGQHEGKRRPLCIYDETLLRADSTALDERTLRQAIGTLSPLVDVTAPPMLAAALGYLQQCSMVITEALAGLHLNGDPEGRGAAVDLPFLEDGLLCAYRGAIRQRASMLRGFGRDAIAWLDISQDPLRVLSVEGGPGVVAAREAVPLALRDVVILDASAPIRELARLDPTVTPVESFHLADLKSFEAVEVHQLMHSGSRTAIEGSFTAERKGTAAVAKEVARIIRQTWDTEQAFLVFTYVRQSTLDPVAELRKGLAAEGVDLQATVPVVINGETCQRPKVDFLTWGQHEGRNGFEHCTSVILAGVLHRSHLDLAAALKGQTGNMAEPAPNKRLRELVESEMAHCIYQAASRGSCRRVTDGKAHPMRLWFLHKDKGIRTTLDRVMPGAAWHFEDPASMTKASQAGKAREMLGRVLAHLTALPADVDKVATSRVKKAIGLDEARATNALFSRAGDLLALQEHGWVRQDRSFVRGARAFGFHDLT